MIGALSPPLAAALAEVTTQGVRFGHRQHIHLAFLAARRYGPGRTPEVMCDWIGQIAAAHGMPERYHATMTIAWARIVAGHVSADPSISDFAAFADAYHPLLDKDLLARHYTAAALGSAAARVGWVAPDLAAI